MRRSARGSSVAPSASPTDDRLVVRAHEPRIPFRVGLDGADGRAEHRRRQRERREEGELLPQQRRLVGREGDGESGCAQLLGDLFLLPPRREIDACKRRLLVHDPWLDPLRLDTDRACEHVLVAFPQECDVVDAIQ